MIHAFALEPDVVAGWGKRSEFRFVRDKFGLGTPRVLLEFPKFSKWKKAVFEAAAELQLSQLDLKRLEELFRLFSEHRVRRADSVYDGVLNWLLNAEGEYDRRPFRGIVARANPRAHAGVLVEEALDNTVARWACGRGENLARTPAAIAASLCAMLVNCKELHLIDPHFGPENKRHRTVLAALLEVLSKDNRWPMTICMHCADKPTLSFFEEAARRQLAPRLPEGCTVSFIRWRGRPGGERFHNRYVLTDLGGVQLGDGLDDGGPGQSDDLHLLTRDQYERRWEQFVAGQTAFDCIDRPAPIVGPTRVQRRSRTR